MIKRETAFAVDRYLSGVVAVDYTPARSEEINRISRKRQVIAMLEAQNAARTEAKKRG